ncbi:acyl-CoA/acyl-ACP dehydrogenase [Natronomonas gomsonensis]|uniref:acyl-CoA dehydrogenase family protein n=1 Tax=Natronomonas gomsonensis TaxID=1046043 RepID=UPI0020CA8631|nr:acyl-CoA dehydrogenase family protein [Natronomonas gomsonensis]MCY4729920.1 acyl-CoA/acyl-ACP dehydrogenase [Natronomonas gomsonensis]
MNTLVTLTDEQSMIADAVADLTAEYDHDYWQTCCREGHFVDELWAELGELGFLGIAVPEKYGGEEMGIPALATLIETFAAHGVPLLAFLSTTTMAPLPIIEYGSDNLKNRFLPGIASGDLRFAFAITEPHSGTNASRIRTSATRDGDEYVVNGEKTYITDAAGADYIQLVTRTTPYEDVANENPYHGGTLLVVDTDADGIETSPLDVSIPEPSGQYTVHFDDVRVPVNNRIGREDAGFSHVFSALNPERVVTAALAVGLGRFVIEKGADYANDREIFDAPTGSYQGVQHPLAGAKVAVEQAALTLQTAAAAHEAGQRNAAAAANVAKYAASEAADKAMDAAVQALGGNAFSHDYPLAALRDWTRFLRIAPVNNEMVLNYVGENLLDLPRSY